MKRLSAISVRLMLVLALTSCVRERPQDSDSAVISDSSIIIEDGEISYPFKIVANTFWTLSCEDSEGNPADWFSVTPSQGNGSTDVSLNILKENTEGTARKGKIVVTCGGKVSEAAVTQRGVGQVSSYIDPQTVAVSSPAATTGRFTLVLSSSGANVTATLPSDAEWLSNLKLIQDVSLGRTSKKTWSFDIAANTMSDSRSAEISVTVSAKGKVSAYTVKVEQIGQGAPSIKTPDVVYMGSNQSVHSQTFWVDGSKEHLTYKISCASASADTGEPWIQDARIDGDNLVITASPNTDSESREGSVYIIGTRASGSGDGSSTTLSVKVYQAGHSAAGILMAASEVSVGSSEAGHYVSFILLNGSKISGNPEANVSWISDIKASEEGRLSYKVSAFDAAGADESDYREGIISFAVDNGASNSALATLRVRQYSSKFTDIVLPSEISLLSKSAVELIPFDAQGGTLEVVDNGSDWLKAVCSEFDGLSVIRISAADWAAAEAGAKLRSGLVALKYTNNGKTAYHYISVYQLAPTINDISLPEVINFDYNEDKVTFAVSLKGGSIGEISCSSSGNWVKSASVSSIGGDSGEITVIVEKWTTATDGTGNRNGMLCVPYINDGVTMYHYIQLNQKSKAFSDIVFPAEVSLPAKNASELVPFDAVGGTLEIVRIDGHESWLKAAEFLDGGKSFLKLSAEDWQASDAVTEFRSSLVALKYIKDGMSAYHYITVKQYAPSIRDINVPAAVNMDFDETYSSFRLALNGGKIGTVSYSSSGNWIKNVKVANNGSNEVNVTVEAEKWTGSGSVTSDRTGTLCIPYKYDGLTIYHYVKVSQKPEPFADIFVPAQLTLQKDASPYVFYLNASKGRIGGIVSGADWLAVHSSTSRDICTVTLTPETNSGSTRHCLLSVPYTMNGATVTYFIDVAQFSETMSALSSYPKIISLLRDQKSYNSAPFALAQGVSGTSTTGATLWNGEAGWTVDASITGGGAVGGAVLKLTTDEWTASSSSPFRMGLVSFPITRIVSGVTETGYYQVPVYQYGPSVTGIDIPESVELEAYDTSTTILLHGDTGGTLTPRSSGATWITGISATPDKIVLETQTAYISVASEPTRSTTITFDYSLGGITTSYLMTVTQKIIKGPTGIIDEMPKGYRHYYWWNRESDSVSSPQYNYSSFKWLDNSATGKKAEAVLYFLGVSTSYDYVANNQNVPCSEPLLHSRIKSCSVESDGAISYMKAVLEFSDPDFSIWRQGKSYELEFNVEGGTMKVPFTIDVFDHNPTIPEAFRQIVPNVTKKDGKYASPGIVWSAMAALDGDSYDGMTLDGVFADKDCTIPQSPTAIREMNYLSNSFTVSYDVIHRKEEGFVRATLHTANGKSEVISIPYRLYSSLHASAEPRINKVVFHIDDFIDDSTPECDDWKFVEVEILSTVGGGDFSFAKFAEKTLKARWSTIPESVSTVFRFKLNSTKDRIDDYYEVPVSFVSVKYYPVLPGEFSISDGNKVRFTSGMLYGQYDGSAWNRQIAEQTRIPLSGGGINMAPFSQHSGDQMDLFGYSTSDGENNYGAPKIPTYVIFVRSYFEGSFKDWGELFPGQGYRTLSFAEWDYLLKRKVTVVVDGVTKTDQECSFSVTYMGTNNMVLLPDNFVWDTIAMGSYEGRLSGLDVLDPKLAASHLAAMEDAGAVFFPISAGYGLLYNSRSRDCQFNRGWGYFTSDAAGDSRALVVKFRERNGIFTCENYPEEREYYRCPVRLVKPL